MKILQQTLCKRLTISTAAVEVAEKDKKKEDEEEQEEQEDCQ